MKCKQKTVNVMCLVARPFHTATVLLYYCIGLVLSVGIVVCRELNLSLTSLKSHPYLVSSCFYATLDIPHSIIRRIVSLLPFSMAHVPPMQSGLGVGRLHKKTTETPGVIS